MQRVVAALFLFCFAPCVVNAQTTNILDLRVGLKDQATYRLFEVFQIRGRWIAPDVGYIDFADARNYREWFIGAGYKPLISKYLTIANELYFVQAAGKASGNARYLQPWTGLFYTFTPKLGGEAAFFPYIPLDDAGRKQWVVERVKLEYAISSVLKAGAGYGAYQFGDNAWQNKPFLTTTITPAQGKFGGLELWLQKLPGGKVQAQFRYELVRTGNKK